MRYLVFTLSWLYLSHCARVLSNGNEGSGTWVAKGSINNGGGVSGPSSPLTLTGAQRPLPAIKVDPTGKVYTTQILKQQLANELGLPLRDLRIVDPSFPSQIQATFTARPKAILFCIENIKVVVQRGEALVFSPYQPEVQEFIPALQAQIMAMTGGPSSSSISSSISSSSSSTAAATNAGTLSGSGGVATLPFELIVLEAALNVAIQTLFRRLRSLSPAVSSALNGLRAESRGLEVVQTQVDELLPLKNKLDVLRKRVKEIKRAITEVLNNDEDMAMMQLTPYEEVGTGSGERQGGQGQWGQGKAKDGGASGGVATASSPDYADGSLNVDASPEACPVPDSSTSTSTSTSTSAAATGMLNLEMMFENYLNEVEWISAELEEEVDEIRNTEENVVLQLDLLRNRILKVELQLSISSFVVACGALVTGLFGMNLLNHFELNPGVFWSVSALLAAAMSTGLVAFRRYAKREKLF